MGKGGGQKDGERARKATSVRVRTEKVIQISILSDKDGHVAKKLPFLKKIRVSDALHHTAKTPAPQ